MSKSNLIIRGLLHALGVAVYIASVAFLMTNVERIFGDVEPGILGPMSFLMLFVLSAAIVGLLVFGKPVMLYLDGMKQEAIQLVIYTVGWLALLTICSVIIMLIRLRIGN